MSCCRPTPVPPPPFAVFLSPDELEDLVESIDRDTANSWTRRSLIQMIVKRHAASAEIDGLLAYAKLCRWRASCLTTLVTTLNGTGLISVAAQFFRDNASPVISGVTFAFLVAALVAIIASTAVIAFHEVRDYQNDVDKAYLCIRSYDYVRNVIDSQLVRRNTYRGDVTDIMRGISHAMETTRHLQLTETRAGSFATSDLEMQVRRSFHMPGRASSHQSGAQSGESHSFSSVVSDESS